MALAGIIQSALIWWEGQAEWVQILASNSWPASKPVSIAINIKNTGTERAIFDVAFASSVSSPEWLYSVGISLNPGESGWVYLYPTTQEAGNYTYVMVLRIPASFISVDTLSFQVSLTSAWEKVGSPIMADVAQAEVATWSKVGSPILADVALEGISGWSKVGSPVLADVALEGISGWSKVGSPVLAAVSQVEVATWSKVGSPIMASIPIGFAIPPDYKLVESTVYPDGKKYSGEAQRCIASFSFLPANWPGSKWFLGHLIGNHIADKVKEQGGLPLTYKLYESGFDYIIVIEAGEPSSHPSAVPFAIAIAWSTVIALALILAIVIVITVVILKTENFIYKSPVAAVASGIILLGIAGAALVGLAMFKGTSVKQAIGGKT